MNTLDKVEERNAELAALRLIAEWVQEVPWPPTTDGCPCHDCNATRQLSIALENWERAKKETVPTEEE